MPAPTTTGGGLMGYASTVDTGQSLPWYIAHEGNVATLNGSFATLTANKTYLVGVFIPGNCVMTGMRTRQNVKGNGNVDLGIYDSSGNLLAHTGSISSNLSGSGTTAQNFISSVSLAPGRYYLALWVDNTTDSFYQEGVGSAPQSWGAIYTSTSTNSGGLAATFSAMGGGGTTIGGPMVCLQGVLQGGF